MTLIVVREPHLCDMSNKMQINNVKAFPCSANADFMTTEARFSATWFCGI